MERKTYSPVDDLGMAPQALRAERTAAYHSAYAAAYLGDAAAYAGGAAESRVQAAWALACLNDERHIWA